MGLYVVLRRILYFFFKGHMGFINESIWTQTFFSLEISFIIPLTSYLATDLFELRISISLSFAWPCVSRNSPSFFRISSFLSDFPV